MTLTPDPNRGSAEQDRRESRGMTAAVTVERLDRAIATVARMMVKHDMPDLIVTIRRL